MVLRHTPIRVDFVVTSLPVGGAEILLLNLVRKLNRERVDPRVICLKEAGPLGPRMAEYVCVHGNLLRNKWDARVLLRLQRLFGRRQTDVAITVGAGDKMFWGRLAARMAGVPVICSALHSTGWPDGIGRLNRLLTPITTGFIACAQRHADFLVEGEGLPKRRVFTIPNGVDTDHFRPDRSRRDWLRRELKVPLMTPMVGIVAALREEKNHLQLVEAARNVLERHPQTHFIVVGEGPERSMIEAGIKRQQMLDNFHMLGNREDTSEILAGLDVFCLTSRNEANPVSILEAMACGIPVVCPDVGSVRESVRHEETGLLTKPQSSYSTADALMQLLSNPVWAGRLGEAARRSVIARHSLEIMVDGYEKLSIELYNSWALRKGCPPLARADNRPIPLDREGPATGASCPNESLVCVTKLLEVSACCSPTRSDTS